MKDKENINFVITYFTLMALLIVSILFFYENKRYNSLKENYNKMEYKLNLIDSVIEEDVYEKYPMIPKEIATYVVQMSIQLDIDEKLPLAILMQENPNFDVEAINVNKNGTVDIGLWQLNDKYLWSDYVKYLPKEVECNPFNWKHSTYIAMHHLKYLSDKLKVKDDIICAYNAGVSSVMNDNIPSSTKEYLKRVNNNYLLLEECIK